MKYIIIVLLGLTLLHCSSGELTQEQKKDQLIDSLLSLEYQNEIPLDVAVLFDSVVPKEDKQKIMISIMGDIMNPEKNNGKTYRELLEESK